MVVSFAQKALCWFRNHCQLTGCADVSVWVLLLLPGTKWRWSFWRVVRCKYSRVPISPWLWVSSGKPWSSYIYFIYCTLQLFAAEACGTGFSSPCHSRRYNLLECHMRGVQPCSFCQLHTWFLTLKVQKLQEVECTCLILPLPTVTGWCDRFRGLLLTREVLCPPRSERPRSPSPAWGGEAGKCEFTFSDLWMHVLTGWASEIRSVLPPRPWSARDWFAEGAFFLKRKPRTKSRAVSLAPPPQKSPTLIPSHFGVNIMGITVQMRCVLLLARRWLWEPEDPAGIHSTCPNHCLLLPGPLLVGEQIKR